MAATISKINPKGAVPALQLDSGEVLTENAVILQYLGDRASWPEILPPHGDFRRYRVLEMVNFITTELHKRFGFLFNPEASDEMKQLRHPRARQEARLYRRASRRRSVPDWRRSDPSRRLSVRDHRLGGKDDRPRQMAEPPCIPRAHDATPLGAPCAAVRRIAGRGTRGLERPRNDAIRPHRRPAPDPGDGAQVHRRRDHAERRRMGREAHLPARHDPRGRRARFRRDLRLRGKRRHRPRPARGGADHGGDGLWLPVDQRLHLDPQHGELDDRPLRLGRGEAEISAVDDHDGADRQLLPDRAVLGLRRGRAEDESGARRRPLCRLRLQGIHLRRRRERDLRDHGPHRRGRARRASPAWSSKRT